MKYLLLISIFIISSVNAKNVERTEILKLVPRELAILNKSDTFESLSSRFKDKIKNTKDQKILYLEYFNKDNDVTIGFNQGKFSYILINLPDQKKSSLFNKIYDSLTEKEKKQLKENNTKSGHDVGRYITVNLKNQSLRLKFKHDESKALQSVLIWNQGEQSP